MVRGRSQTCDGLVIPTATRGTSATGIPSSNGLITGVRVQADLAERARKNEERTHDFEERYAIEHERHYEHEQAKRDRP